MGYELLLKESELYRKKGLNRLFYQVLLDEIECVKIEDSVLNQFRKDRKAIEHLLREDNIPFFE
ncbi:MAG: hypothetical protein ACFFDS_09500, partial [Candidatus Thorarchaeota archaeon]